MVEKADAIEWLESLDDGEADLLFTSPPYETQRAYSELAFDKAAEKWVEWMVEVVDAAAPKVKGLIAIVCEGRTKNYRYSATPLLLAADLHRIGYRLRKPAIYRRVGIPGSGGPDWLRNDYEFVLCIGPGGRLPWSDNKACGHEPKWMPGGKLSHRTPSGRRVAMKHTKRTSDGWVVQGYNPPSKANPGNVIQQTYTSSEVEKMLAQYESGEVIDCVVGGGQLGHDLAHENEAPFPLSLAEFFVKSFCPPDGLVVDPFCGSSSTGHAALVNGRRYRGCDLRQSQVDLSQRRLADVTENLKGTAA